MIDVTVDPNNWTMEKVVSLTVVVDEMTSPTFFSIGPNPVENTLNVYFSEADNTSRKIRIYDLSGKEMLFTNNGNKHIHLDVSGLSKGVYLLKVTEGDNIRVKRFVK